VVVLGTLKGILVAVIVSVLALAQQAYNPPVHVVGRKRGTQAFRPLSPDHPDDETWPGLLILRPEGRLFFANAERIADRTRPLIDAARPAVVILDCSAVSDIEYTAVKMLAEGEAKLRAEGAELWLAALNPEPLAVVQRSKLGGALGRERMFISVQGAVDRYEARSAGRTPAPAPGSANPKEEG
jgi:MFS superfamily sulfate permease-like transporter